MQDKMSLFTLLNPSDIDSGASLSARSSPDPITPSSVASVPETWTPATRWSSFHRRNESFGSTVSSSSNQPPVPFDQVRFPPFNELDNNSRQLAMRFKVDPLGAIAPRQRPVSYNSDKRALKAKTGINKFHVFEYSFQLEGEEKKWYVMWDYRLGLVRFTPFFKCLRYNKTAPARMVSVNPGLDSLKHNITGGSISAQGYWIPYSCARELATKFCYPIAGALIPIFGPNFPDDCLHPSNPDFEDMVISQETIRAAELDTRRYLDRQLRSRRGSRSPAITSHPHTPDGQPLDGNGDRSRVEGRWSEPPSTGLETGHLTSHGSHWPSRPGTQDGSSPSGHITTPRPTPKWSNSYSPSFQGNLLPPLRDGLSLPPLRSHLQQLASQEVDINANRRLVQARDLSTIDPRLLGVEDEEASLACSEDSSPTDLSGDVAYMEIEIDHVGEESKGLASVAKAAEILLSMRYEHMWS